MHACARSIHPALDLIEEVMAQRPDGRLDPNEVERIDFRAYISPTTLHNKTPKRRPHLLEAISLCSIFQSSANWWDA